jgi:hypothetical protein
VREDGSLTYLYYPSSGSYPDDLNNEIRQLMGSRLLAQYTSENSSLLSLHKKNLDRMLASLYREEGDLAYILFENKSKLGGIAMGLRMLAASPLYGEHEEEASLLANGLLSLQNPDGSFRAWLINPSYEYDEDYLLTFYSGEAIVALTEYYALIKDERILNAAILSQNHYVDEYVTHLEENYYPAYVPWQTISLHNLYLITGNESYAEAAFALNDKLIELQNIDRTPYLDYAGRFYNSDTPQYGSPHASSDAVYTEGLIYAWHLATLLNDSTHVKRYHFAIMLSLENLDRLQFSGAKMYYLQNSVRVDGAIRSNVQSNIVRIDSTQHALDGMEAMRSFQLATNPSG